MRRSWPFALAVIAIGATAGVAIAGRPQSTDGFVLDSAVTVAGSESSTTTVSAQTVPAQTVPATIVPATTATSQAATTTPVAPTVAKVSTTIVPTTVPTTVAPTTTAAPTTSTIAGPLPRDQVRLVLANGDGRFRLASVVANRIRPLGYAVGLGDALTLVKATVIYYRPGFDDEAAFAAVDIGVPDAAIFALPTNRSQPITTSDANGDVIIVLGPDAPR
jgi:hypothetical protein